MATYDLDPITLDQLRTFLVVVEEGSFSAAARRLKRVQSAVSHAMANLESQINVSLWDRATKRPTLTEAGQALLPAAERVCEQADAFRATADHLVRGLEPSLSLCVDMLFPVPALADLARHFAKKYPTVTLRIHTETMSAVAARVLDGTCQLGVAGPTCPTPGLERTHLASVRMVPVVAKNHPLATVRGPVSTTRLAGEVQIVLSERGDLQSPDQAVLSRQTWRVVDLATKHELLRQGLGWGNLPEHRVRHDLKRGTLVRLRPAAWSPESHTLSLAVIHRAGFARGPATRWLIACMTQLCHRDISVQKPRRAATRKT